MIRAVCDSSPIIGLSQIGKLDLLWTLFDEVMIPEAVFEEIVHGNVVQFTSAIELEKAVLEKKIYVFTVENQSMVEQLQGRLHRGEGFQRGLTPPRFDKLPQEGLPLRRLSSRL